MEPTYVPRSHLGQLKGVYDARFLQRRKAIFLFEKAGDSEWVCKNEFKISIWKYFVQFFIEGWDKSIGSIVHEWKQGEVFHFWARPSVGDAG